MDLIRIHNNAKTPLVLNGNERIEIPAGGDRIVRFDIAASWFGDPRTDNNSKDQLRTQVFNQTQFLWGYAEGLQREDGKTWEDVMPNVDCFDMDDNPVLFVIHDPEGKTPWTGAGMVDPSTQDNATLNAQISALTEQVAKLTALALARAGDDTPAPVDPATGTDLSAAIVDMTTLPAAPKDEQLSEDAPRTARGRAKANA